MDLNMSDLFGKVADMQQRMAEVQDELAQKKVTVEAGGGMVTVTANGAMRITSIKLDPEVVDTEELELLEDLIVAGVNKALDEASEMAKSEMQNVAGGMLPPGFDLGSLGM